MSNKQLTIQEAATFLGVSTKTLRRWDAAGFLVPQRTLGNQRRYILKDLQEIKDKQKKPTTYPKQTGETVVSQVLSLPLNTQLNSESGSVSSSAFSPVPSETNDFFTTADHEWAVTQQPELTDQKHHTQSNLSLNKNRTYLYSLIGFLFMVVVVGGVRVLSGNHSVGEKMVHITNQAV